MVAGRKTTGDDEIPDLGAPMSGQGRTAGRSGVTPKTTGSLAPRDPFDDELDEGHRTTHSISLEDEGDALSYPLALDHGEDALESTSAGARSLPARPREPEKKWPSGLSPDSASIDLAATEIAMTAEYGPPPANHFAALSYAFRVFARKRALRGRVKALNDELVQAEHDRDGILGRMIDSLRPELAQSDAGRKVLEPLDRVEVLANEKRTALSGLSDGFHRRSTELDAEATGIGKELETSKRDTELARAVVDERQHSYDRVDA
ncbi:MAG TPA: hypothetical protein VH062_03765, partial [Polyangiaceae bacterium]|nr:hypothetical protein [Polyangiaceae bacterium]